MAERFDWPGLMRLGVGELKLSPTAFWGLTPAELVLLSGRDPGRGGGPMTRAALDALTRIYPDERAERGDDCDGR